MTSRFKAIVAGALGALVLTATPVTSFAYDSPRYSRGDRFDHQHWGYYNNGRRELSNWEIRKLERARAALRRVRWHMLNDDGRLDRRERARLERMRDEINRDLYRYRHN